MEILVANALVDTVCSLVTMLLVYRFLLDGLSFPRGLFCDEKASDRKFSKQRRTFRSLTVFSPND